MVVWSGERTRGSGGVGWSGERTRGTGGVGWSGERTRGSGGVVRWKDEREWWCGQVGGREGVVCVVDACQWTLALQLSPVGQSAL